MKYQWNARRRKEDLNIESRYLEKTEEMQNRRELSFLLQEAAFSEKLEILGYHVQRVHPVVTPDQDFADTVSLTGAGFAGKNGRFICEEFGSRVCIGYLIIDAPLMGGDYRYPSYQKDICEECRKCIEVCPAHALTEQGINKEKCLSYRNKKENQNRVSEHCVEKCNLCMRCCPAGTKAKWEV